MRLNVARVALISLVNRVRCLSCALKPFTTRRPNKVSSMEESISAFCSCPLVDARLSDRPIRPMQKIAMGNKAITKSVNCQEMMNIVNR